MPAVQTAKMTATQFFELGEDPPGIRLELVDGEIEMSPSPVPRHSHVEKILGTILVNHTTEHDLGVIFGDVDTVFGEHDVRRPDLIYFAKDRLHLVGEKAMEGPPDLCVEILSPSSVETDRRRKFGEYESGGVAHYWIVDPMARTIEGYRLEQGRYQHTGRAEGEQHVSLPPFDALSIPLARLWWR